MTHEILNENPRIEIILGDCLEYMKTIKDKSIDLVLTDPPYNVSRKNNFGTMRRYNSYKGMDFGEWDWDFDQEKWIQNMVIKLNLNNPNKNTYEAFLSLPKIKDILKD